MIKTGIFITSLCFSTLLLNVAHASSWLPIDPEELKMTSEPKASGAPAIILELQVDSNDERAQVAMYQRIKVLTEEGRKLGDIEIPYDKGDNGSVRDIAARVIQPDGKVIEFNGEIYDKLIIKSKNVRYQAKVFSLPDVSVGSIIEYRFVYGEMYSYRWVLSQKLFMKHGKYSLLPNKFWQLRWSWPQGLPAGTPDPVEKNGRVVLETHDVPAFIEEDYMPPEIEMQYRVDFVYNFLHIQEKSNPGKFWQEADKIWYRAAFDFIDHSGAMEKVVAQLLQPSDSPDQKLRKLYSHVQQLRNLSFEKRKTEQERERAELKNIRDVADMEKYGYGNEIQLTFLYVALVRAAGFQADIAYISTRNRYFFDPNVMNPMQLNAAIAVVTLNGKELYIDPGVPFVPFAMLPWYQSGVSGLRLSKEGGSWIKIPLTKATQTQMSRKATLKLNEDTLEGTVTVTYTGLEAIYHRLEERNEDAAARKEHLDNELKRDLPTGCDVEVTNVPDWSGVDTPFVVEYKVRIPGWASFAGKHTLMPIGLFGAEEKHIFEQEKRVHPIYFHYAHINDDDITIELPSGWRVDAMPKDNAENISMLTFFSHVESVDNTIRIRRNLAIDGIYLPEKYYLALRDFYQSIRSNDEEQIVLTPVVGSSKMTKSGARN